MTDQAISRIKERADTLILARARLGQQMRIIFAAGGENALRNVFAAELEAIKGANDNGAWIG